jgi:hypothetical protein
LYCGIEQKPIPLFKVTSTKNFNVKVKAGGANFMNGTNVIPVNVLTIKAAAASATMGGTKNAVVLSVADQTLVANAPLGSALTESGLYYSCREIIFF